MGEGIEAFNLWLAYSGPLGRLRDRGPFPEDNTDEEFLHSGTGVVWASAAALAVAMVHELARQDIAVDHLEPLPLQRELFPPGENDMMIQNTEHRNENKSGDSNTRQWSNNIRQ